ncbi:hypothetical protein BD408DRAFT_349098 [Parasitella parasitica]|nr:hypothetical protein BD408DRAFT_349098 [Parasitella parasitica]
MCDCGISIAANLYLFFFIVESLLKIPTVRIKNIPGTTDKLQKIIQGGRRNLHFISGEYQRY